MKTYSSESRVGYATRYKRTPSNPANVANGEEQAGNGPFLAYDRLEIA
jgi:hypothetical protein